MRWDLFCGIFYARYERFSVRMSPRGMDWPGSCLGRNMTETYRTDWTRGRSKHHPTHHKCHMEVTNYNMQPLEHMLSYHHTTTPTHISILNWNFRICPSNGSTSVSSLELKNIFLSYSDIDCLDVLMKNFHLKTWLDFKFECWMSY